MAFWRKPTNPIDRAVADLDQQIVELQKQMRELSAEPSHGAREGDPVSTRTQAVTKFVKEMLTPPPKGPAAPSYRTRRDQLDMGAEPLKDLEAEPIAFSQKPEPDLFPQSPRVAGAAAKAQIDCSTKPEGKLAHYLSAGSIKTYKPLKRVQRQNRNRFFMWLGLSFVALWFIYAVVR